MAESRIKQGWLAAQVAAGIALTIFGLVQLLQFFFEFTHSPLATALVAIMLGLVCTIPFLYHLFAPATLREFGLGRLTADRLCLRHEKEIDIRPDLSAWVTVRRTWIFLKEPPHDDLFDSYSIDSKLQIDGFKYISPDSLEAGRKCTTPDRLTIFWQPKTAIQSLIPYTHEDAWQPPMKYDMPSAMTGFHAIERTGIVTISMKAPFDIERVSIFRRPRFRSLRSDVSHMNYALNVKEFRWGSAELSADRRTVIWQMHDPPSGWTYDCIVFKVGGVAFWKQEIQKKGTIGRLLAYVREFKIM